MDILSCPSFQSGKALDASVQLILLAFVTLAVFASIQHPFLNQFLERLQFDNLITDLSALLGNGVVIGRESLLLIVELVYLLH